MGIVDTGWQLWVFDIPSPSGYLGLRTQINGPTSLPNLFHDNSEDCKSRHE